MGCDFIPDACAALAIRACLAAKECISLDLDVPGLEESFGGTSGLALEARVALDEAQQCLVQGLQQAFASAGCPFPGVPAVPPPPDFASCQAAIAAIKDQISNPLGFLGGVVQITFDSTGLPIRIVAP